MLKKIIAWTLVVALTATLAISGTLAYLTDRDSEANVFTVGDVNIDLNEDFNQGSALIPGVIVEKKPTVTNLGPNEAYVWTTVAVPAELASVIEFDGMGAGWEAWTKAPNTTKIDGMDYALYTILHTDALGVGAETDVLFSKVALNQNVDIDPNGNWFTVTDGTAIDLGWNNSDGSPVIYVSAYAIQTEGFADVNAAYTAYNTQWGDKGTAYAPAAEVIDTPVELEDALNSGTPALLGADIVLDKPLSVSEEVYIDLNGHTLTANCLDLKEGGTISNGVFRSDKNNTMLPHLKVYGSDVTLENLTVYINHYMNYGASGNYSCAEFSGVDVIDGSLVLNNCDIKVTNDSRYTDTYIYGISVDNGTVTMNGGSIMFDSVQAARYQYNTVVSCFNSEGAKSVVNLNNVDIQNANCVMVTYADLEINTNVSSVPALSRYLNRGGSCTINYTP